MAPRAPNRATEGRKRNVAVTDGTHGPALGTSRRHRIAEDGVFGMGLFVFSEIMLFAGLISAFTIARATALTGVWPPPGQPRLPVGTTAFNTLVLLGSGVMLALAYRAFRRRGHAAAVRPMAVAIALGAFFVAFQGFEWARLLAEGLTVRSSLHGAFFYLIVGAHGLHALVAVVALAVLWTWLRAGRLTASAFGAAQLFWFFVVLMWPVIYWRVYL